MSRAKAAAEGMSNLAKMYKSVLEGAEVLNEIGDVENTLAEMKKQRDRADKAKAQAEDELVKVTSQLEKVSEDIHIAEEKKNQLVSEGDSHRQQVIEAAIQKIKEMKKAADDAENEKKRVMAKELADHQERLKEIKAKEAAAILSYEQFVSALNELKAKY